MTTERIILNEFKPASDIMVSRQSAKVSDAVRAKVSAIKIQEGFRSECQSNRNPHETRDVPCPPENIKKLKSDLLTWIGLHRFAINFER